MSLNAEKIYNLLPEVYRRRDHEMGEPLRALIGVIAEQVVVIEGDLAQRYDDLFIETCADWVAPYIGDLLGVRGLHEIPGVTRGRRAEVANTIAYRRRKGTATMLEQLARDVTGWPARVVEFFELLATTQYMNHIRPGKGGTADLRQWEAMENVGSAFEQLAHTVDVRRISTSDGLFNISNIGVFLWRLESIPLTKVRAYPVDARRFMFNPLGNDTQLFTHPTVEESITHPARRINVPDAISRRVLKEFLVDYYGQDRSLVLWRGDTPIPIEEIVVCNLSDATAGDWAHTPEAGTVGIDPVLGRIAFGDEPTEEIAVSYYYGFSAQMGGGEYARLPVEDPPAPSVSVPTDHTTIQDAVRVLAAGGTLEILNSDTYAEDFNIQVNDEQSLVIRSATGHRPHLELTRELVIEGQDATLTLDGLLIAGAPLRIRGGLRELRLRHCTLVPGHRLNRDGTPTAPGMPSLIVDSPETKIIVEHSILGPIQAEEDAVVRLSDSIVDATDRALTVYASNSGEDFGAPLTVDRCTLIGRVQTRILSHASNSIFYGLADEVSGIFSVHAERLQEGCIRFSYVALDARVPRRYRCQPSLEISNIQPSFTSLRYGRPGYCQLAVTCPKEISEGADDEAEMGAFHDLFQPHRVTNLRLRLDEYLRFGLERGEFFET